jgi:acetyl esterase/lipase
VQGVVAFYSPSDLVNLVETSPRIPDLLRNLIKSSPFATMLMAGLKQVSPQTWINGDAPPFLMIHGTADSLVPVQQSETMCGALRKSGASCELFEVPGAGHGLNFWEGQAALMGYKQKMVDWLRWLLVPAL